DLKGIKKRALDGSAEASKSMREFHKLVSTAMARDLRPINHAYIWNDSVLLHGYVDKSASAYKAVMRAADKLKQEIDTVVPSYAVAVKGKSFPPLGDSPPRVTVIEASSYAMANCFEVEAEAKRHNLRSA